MYKRQLHYNIINYDVDYYIFDIGIRYLILFNLNTNYLFFKG